MKNKLLLLFFIATPFYINACDICGCGVGNNYLGILPEFRSHIFGVRYRYNSMLTHVGVGGSNTYLTTKENYHITEAWAGWNFGTRFRTMIVVPYAISTRHNQGNTETKNGLGDISVSGFYEILNSRKTTSGSKMLIQTLWLGGGIKLPSGNYNAEDKATGNNANLFQSGTGSTDFNFTMMYDIRLQDAGLNISSNYKINTINKEQYQYGNKLNLAAQAYYKFRVDDKFTIAPNTGLQYEKSQQDNDAGFTVSLSGGTLLSGTIGTEISFNKTAMGFNFQAPLTQNLASGIIKAKNRMMVHFAFTL